MKRLLWIVVVLPFLVIVPAKATEPASDCVIRDFQGRYTLNLDSTLAVMEYLKVDCGSLPNKHGIFRILPTQVSHPDGFYNQTKIDQLSITDGTGSPHPYQTIKDSANHTLTWKIGDADQTISGVNEYKIDYVVRNVTYDADGQTIFNWNLSGNFWQLPIDHFLGIVTLPASLKTTGVTARLYDGFFGSPTNTFSTLGIADGPDGPQYAVESQKTFLPGIGATLYASFPTGVVIPYQPTFLDRYGAYLWLILPLLTLLIAYKLWAKRGRDPKLNYAELVQYAPPYGLKPLEAGLLETNGRCKTQFLTASIIDLAVRGYIKIEELPKTLLSDKDYQLTLLKLDDQIAKYERTILSRLFGQLKVGDLTKTSEQKYSFYSIVTSVADQGKDRLKELKFLDEGSQSWRFGMLALGIISLMGGLIFLAASASIFGLAVSLCGVIIIVFGFLMDRRTPEGAKAFWELRGFKMYMEKVEKYRAKFYEQENIFEKYLPYAVAFGLTDKWIKACKQLYDDQNIIMTAPLWYAGTGDFNISSFDTAVNTLSSQIGKSISSSPASSGGGGGFSGGGGGGGGGGSW